MKYLFLFFILLSAHFFYSQNYKTNYAKRFVEPETNLYHTADAMFICNEVTKSLSKLDDKGDIIWSIELDFVPLSMTSMPNNGYIIFGYNVLVKVNNLGNILWTKSIVSVAKNSGLNDLQVHDIECDELGNIYFNGLFNSKSVSIGTETVHTTGADDQEGFLFKLDKNGTVIRGINFGVSPGGFCMKNTSNAIFLGVGGKDRISLIKYDHSLNAVWTRNAIGDADYGDRISKLLLDSNEDPILVGIFASSKFISDGVTLTRSDTSLSFADLFIMKFNNAGNLQFFRSFATSSRHFNESVDAVIDHNGGFLVAGLFCSEKVNFDGFELQNPQYVPISEVTFKQYKYLVKFNANGFATKAILTGNESYMQTGCFDSRGYYYNLMTLMDNETFQFNSEVLKAKKDPIIVNGQPRNYESYLLKFDNNLVPLNAEYLNRFYADGIGILPGYDVFFIGINVGTDTQLEIIDKVIDNPSGDEFYFFARLSEKSVEVNENKVKSLRVFPNPSNEKIMLTGFLTGSYSIIDVNGRVMKKFKVESTTDVTIDISDLKSGTYFITGEGQDSSTSNQFLVSK